jgi:predicted transcriptional regulator
MSEPAQKRDFYKEILDHLLINQSGLTITDIANDLNTSRITASKYIEILKAEKKVVSKKIGAYKLYYSAERSLIPKKVMLAYYTGLLTSLKKEIKDKSKYKEFGKTIVDYIESIYLFSFPDNKEFRKGPDYTNYLKNVKKLIIYTDFIYEENPKIEMEPIENGAIFKISKIKLFEKSKDFAYHYYLASGVIERFISKHLEKDVECSVEEIDLKNNSVKLKIIIRD